MKRVSCVFVESTMSHTDGRNSLRIGILQRALFDCELNHSSRGGTWEPRVHSPVATLVSKVTLSTLEKELKKSFRNNGTGARSETVTTVSY